MLKVKLNLNDSLEYLLIECEEFNIDKSHTIRFFNDKNEFLSYSFSDITFLHVIDYEVLDEGQKINKKIEDLSKIFSKLYDVCDLCDYSDIREDLKDILIKVLERLNGLMSPDGKD